jgi:peptide deformylase
MRGRQVPCASPPIAGYPGGCYGPRMAIRPILTYPDPLLREVAQPVTQFDDALKQLVEDMAETMYDAPGVGLAANQIGVLQRVFVIDIAGEDEPSDLKVFVNPELVSLDGVQNWQEGCLSFPGVSEEIKRAERVHVRAQNERGEFFELQADGLLAVALQHENDHLNGVLMVDKFNAIKRRMIGKKVARATAEAP